MAETFLININCSKVLSDNENSQYTMFIDSSKMSIVYELVEWVRWMFSLENCFYITHNNSIIHELEDIQFLSKLQNFELKPCGRTNCVHKKMYRTLLKNLNLFVSWNGTKVHKYFLHKLNQMDEKLTQESKKASPRVPISCTKDHYSFLDYKNTNFDNHKDISSESGKFLLNENNLPRTSKESVTPEKKRMVLDKIGTSWEANNELSPKMKANFDKKMTSNENLNNLEDKFLKMPSYPVSENETVETEKITKGNISCSSPAKTKLKTVQESSKNFAKSYSKKYVKPFSLGEILSNMREEFEKQKVETNIKKTSPSPSFQGGDFDVEENSFVSDNKTSGGKKRQRTRRRKKPKKENLEELISPFLEKTPAECSFNSSSNLKPNHIRFDSDEDNLMETEFVNDYLKMESKNENEIVYKDLSNGFLQNESKEIVTMVSNGNSYLSETFQITSAINNNVPINKPITSKQTKMDCSVVGELPTEEKLLDLDEQASDNISHTYSAHENVESKILNPDLNMLLSLKEKFKNAVVIERFY